MIEMPCRGLRLASIATSGLVLAALGGIVLAAQDKYTVRVPNGLAFSDFRGYEDWQVVSTSRTDDLLKVMVANPTMIDAYRAGIPGNGKPFPDGSKIAKIEWKFKKSTEAPFSVDVPDILQDVFFIEKDNMRFPATSGWGYAAFDYNATSDAFTPNKDGSVANCGYACHTIVRAKDYIFHSYQMR
jgi:Cytochrome P460